MSNYLDIVNLFLRFFFTNSTTGGAWIIWKDGSVFLTLFLVFFASWCLKSLLPIQYLSSKSSLMVATKSVTKRCKTVKLNF